MSGNRAADWPGLREEGVIGNLFKNNYCKSEPMMVEVRRNVGGGTDALMLLCSR